MIPRAMNGLEGFTFCFVQRLVSWEYLFGNVCIPHRFDISSEYISNFYKYMSVMKL